MHLRQLRIDGHTNPQPESPCAFMEISLYIILLTRNSIPSKISVVTFTIRIVSKFTTIIVVISHLQKCH